MKYKIVLVSCLFIISSILVACSPPTTPAPTVTPVPTNTPAPTSTPTVTPTVTPQPCYTLMDDYIKRSLSVSQEWLDTYKTANSTARIALSPVILKLQEERRTVQELDSSGCTATFKEFQLGAMNASIDGYTAFMGEQPDNIVNGYFAQVGEYSQKMSDEIGKFQAKQAPYDDK